MTARRLSRMPLGGWWLVALCASAAAATESDIADEWRDLQARCGIGHSERGAALDLSGLTE